MSTAPPTTLAPTTLATTLAPTTTLTTLAPTTDPDTDIICDPLEMTLYIKGVRSGDTISPDPDLNRTHRVGPIEMTVSLEGENSGHSVNADDTNQNLSISLLGSIVIGQVISCSPLELTFTDVSFPVFKTPVQCNFAKWSKIGRADFTVEEDQEAGEMPLGWKGCVYDCMKLGKSVIYYGENGVTALTPQGTAMGMKILHHIGGINKGAVAGDEFEQYFIDTNYELFRLTEDEGLRRLGYSEFLENMGSIKMSFDVNNRLIYICDGTYGFVYSTRDGSFGTGPVNVTGYGVQGGINYVAAPDEIEIPKFYIVTDIYDFSSRNPKTIESLELGTDLVNNLEAMIETRVSNKSDFIKSRWILVNPSGIVFIPCYGIEFRFHVRSYIYEYFELDYIRVNGFVHEFNYLNRVGGMASSRREVEE